MAFEMRTVDVVNEREEYIVNLYLSFGWTLKSSQRVYCKDTYPEFSQGTNGDLYVRNITNIVDYTKLVFERDKNLPNYHQIVALENRAHALLAEAEGFQKEVDKNWEILWDRYKKFDVRKTSKRLTNNLIIGACVVTFVLSILSAMSGDQEGIIEILFGHGDFITDTLYDIFIEPVWPMLISLAVGIISVIFKKTMKKSWLDLVVNNPDGFPEEKARYDMLRNKLIKNSAFYNDIYKKWSDNDFRVAENSFMIEDLKREAETLH